MSRNWTPFVLFVGSAATGLTPVADGDVFWHLAAGREMLRTGNVLTHDMFSTSAAGRPWIDVHWLFQLAVYGVHRAGGLQALVFCKCLLLGASSLLLYSALARHARPLFVPIFIAAMFAARHLLLVRPVMITLFCLALFFLLLERCRRTGRGVWLWSLPFIQVLWCNSQGLFALGPAMIAAYAIAAAPSASGIAPALRGGASRRLRALLCVLGACLLCAMLTPYGVHALALPTELLARLMPHAHNPYAQVAENVPPLLLERVTPGQLWHVPWFLGLLALAFVTSRRRVLLSHALLVAGFTGLALIANRNVLLLYFMAAPIAAQLLSPALRRARFALRRTHATRAAPWLARTALLTLLLAVGTAAAREPRFDRPTPFRVPIASAAIIAKHGGTGTIFAADHQAGYLIWKLYPNFRPYIDTRLVLHTPEEYDDYLDLADNPHRFDVLAQREGFSHVVLPVAYPDRYVQLIAHLYQRPEWKLVFTDGSEVLFTRRELAPEDGWDLGSSASTDRLLRDASARFGTTPRLLDAARLQIATLQLAVHELQQAERTLAQCSSPAALVLRARARLASGDLAGAEALAARLLSAEHDDVESLDVLAQVYLRRGELARAEQTIDRALERDPFDREATGLMAAMEGQHEP